MLHSVAFRGDVRNDLARTRELFAAPLLHLELWWQHESSRQAAQSEGDRFGPFYFPFLALKGQAALAAHNKDQLFPPATPISPDWKAMCPVQPGWRTVVCESAEDMAGRQPLRHHQIWVVENGTGCEADCLYYDVGPCAAVPTHCYAQNHVHAPGAGRCITQAHVSLIDETRRRASAARGRYVPVGTECVSEPFVGCLDLYFARNTGFNPDMEVFPYVRRLTWLPDGRMEMVPLFPFIYHEHGPMAVEGVHPVYPWGLSEADDFFTWAEARTVLWGGLMTAFPLLSDSTLSEERVRFLRSLVAARTDFARDFLAYGRMQRPPAVECGTIQIDHGLANGGWLRKIRFSQPPPDLKDVVPLPDAPPDRRQASDGLSVEEWAQGLLSIPAVAAKNPTIRVPSVLCQAYTLGDDRLGILLINLRRESEESVRLVVDPISYGLPAGTYEFGQAAAAHQQRLGVFEDRREIKLGLPPREVLLLEATHASRR